MAIIEKDIFDKYNEGVALALGFFDSVHLGHCTLINECVSSNYIPAVFTFRNNPDEVLGKSNSMIYTYNERVKIFEKLGVGICISALFDEKFMTLSGEEFLDRLITDFNVKMLVVGSDFRCGYHAMYGQNEIVDYCDRHNVRVIVKDLVMVDGSKIASRDIKKMLINGDIAMVNRLLPYNYTISGIVKKGRNVGGKVVGFPTANIPYPNKKVLLKAGVYNTKILIDGVKYPSLTNVGTHPTFNDDVFNIESFVVGYNDNLYDKFVVVEFLDYIREVKKFNSPEELSRQISMDLEKVLK